MEVKQVGNLALGIFKTLMEHHQKLLSHLEDFYCSVGGGLSESVKKGKFVTKIFFQIMLNEALKSCRK